MSDIEITKTDIHNRKNKVKKYIPNLIIENKKVLDVKIIPTKKKMLQAADIVKEYIIKNKRKVFGGMAINEAIIAKNPKKSLYTSNDFPDYDFYSPDPIKDMITIANLLVKAGFKEVSAKEAFHTNTYKIQAELYENELADISYVWSFNYHKIPTFVVKGIHYVRPEFQIMDMYRILTNPMTGWFKVEKTYERCQLLENFYLTQTKKQISQLSYNKKSLDTPKYLMSHLNELIDNFLKVRNDVIIIGNLAYNNLIETSKIYNMKKKLIPISKISVYTNNYDNVISDCISFIKKNLDKTGDLTVDQYHPFLELYGKSSSININHHNIITIYSTDICQPYYLNNGLKYASYHLTLLHLYANRFKSFTFNKKNDISLLTFMIKNLQYAREYFYKKNKKIGIEKTPYQELQIECMGNEIHTPFYEMVQRTKKNKSFRYFPSSGKTQTYKEMMKKKMIFPNYSGNQKNKEPITIKLKKKIDLKISK